MSQENNNIKKDKKQYKHLKYEDRIKIYTLINLKNNKDKRIYNNSQIAKMLNVHRSTISRELRFRIKSKINPRSGKIKNLYYKASSAQDDYKFKRGLSKGEYKILKKANAPMKEFIENKILECKWSPDVVIGYMNKHNYFNKEGFEPITRQTIYNAIRYNIINVKITDTRRMKEYPKYEASDNKNDVPESKKEYSIELRPDSINNRLEFGHFEIDTVISTSKGIHECLLTLTERMTRYEIIFKISSKSKTEVLNKFTKLKSYLKNDFNKIFKSITSDNGTEFSEYLEIIKLTNINYYFCHPYASNERGTNERHNGMIRYFIKKGELFENYSLDDINNIADWMNNYPRRIFNYSTPAELFYEHIESNSLFGKILNLQEKLNTI